MRRSLSMVPFLLFLAPHAGAADRLGVSLDPYGSFRGHLAIYERRADIQNNASRFGIGIDHEAGGGWSLFARGEWGINFVTNDVEFNVDNSGGSGFGRIVERSTNQALWTRLGYFGVGHGRYGELSLGKRWSVYSDVALLTDMFEVFGGEGSGMYNAGTDGGYVGTGRAEKVIIYRNETDRIAVGAQAQARGAGGRLFDSFGFSLRIAPVEGLLVGAAWNRAFPSQSIIEGLPGARDRADAAVFAARYARGPFEGAVTWSLQRANDFVQVDDVSVVFDADGAELYLGWLFVDRLRTYGGFNWLSPAEPHPLLHQDFRIRYLVLGSSYSFDPLAVCYAEVRLDDSVEAHGSNRYDVFVIGFRIGFRREGI